MKDFDSLKDKLSPEQRKQATEMAREILTEMALSEIRKARKITQKQLARRLNVTQPSVARLERTADMHLSTLSKTVRALGGELAIYVRFPSGLTKLSSQRRRRNARRSEWLRRELRHCT